MTMRVPLRLGLPFIIVAGLCGLAAEAQGAVQLGTRIPGVALEAPSSVIVALPVTNFGDADATSVQVTAISLSDGVPAAPATLPVSLGTIGPDEQGVVNARFTVATVDFTRAYLMTVDGSYMFGGQTFGFQVSRFLRVPRPGPGFATVHSGFVVSQVTVGPLPSLGDSPIVESNEARPPVPIGSPLNPFPLTATTTGVLDFGPIPLPGPSAGAAVAFVKNTQSNGVANRFPPDPSGASSGNSASVVLATSNLSLKLSTDRGATFPTTISDFSTVFGDKPDGGYCCDQVVHYIRRIDRLVWLIQTNRQSLPTDAPGTANGPNRLRVAWARPADVATNFFGAWTYVDLTSGFFGLGNDWLDYPDLSLASDHLYLAVDDVNRGGLLVARISFADMQLPPGNSITVEWTDPNDGKSATGSHLAQNSGGTMFWAGHYSTSKLRIFRWDEGSNQYSWTDRDITTWLNTDYTSQTSDGQYWLAPRPKNGNIVGAAHKPFAGLVPPGEPTPAGEVWFAWTAGRDTSRGFKHPYVEVVRVNDETSDVIGQGQVWNGDHSYAYPALATNNLSAEVAISLMWGGGKETGAGFFMNHAVGFLFDFVVYITTASDVTFTANPATATGCDDASGGKVAGRCTRSGDYLSLRRVGDTSGIFGTLGYEARLVDPTMSTDCLTAPGCRFDVHYVEFGRVGDVFPPPPPR